MSETPVKCIASAILIAAAFMGCADEGTPHPEPSPELARHVPPVADGDVVATFNGHAITADAFARFWRDHPELSREDAIASLVRRELVLEAKREEFDRFKEPLAAARKRGLVKALLEHEVEPRELPPTSDAEVSGYVATYMAEHSRPPGLTITQFVLVVPQGSSAQTWARGKELIEEYRARFVLSPDPLAEMQITREQLGERVEGMIPRVDRGLTFASVKLGQDEKPPEGWLNFFPEVVAVVDAVAKEEGVGAMTAPVRSSVGWHIFLVDAILPATRPPAEAIQEYVAREHARSVYAERYQSLIVPLATSADFDMFAENLEESAVKAR